MKISAIVVGRNEARKLEKCLEALRFCDEILYADLNSADSSVEVASKYGCRLYKFREFGPSCEHSQAKLIKDVKNDWVLLVDPDEVIDPTLEEDIKSTLIVLRNNQVVGDIYVPWQFYFGKRRLKGTVWGHNKSKGILIHRNRFEILPITHYGRRLLPGFVSHEITRSGNNVLHHFWMEDRKTFVAKHLKYLKDEGNDRYNLGQRISLIGVLYNLFFQFFNCYILKKGYKDGFVGIYLSLFWCWYITNANFKLYKITLKRKNEYQFD